MMNEEDIERGIKALYQMSKEKNFKSPTKKMMTITMNEMANEIEKLKNQQKEFIEYMNKIIKELELLEPGPGINNVDEELNGYLIQRANTFKEILSKYKEIIGGKDES